MYQYLLFLFVKLVFTLVLLNVVLVPLLKVLGKDDVSVLPDGVHPSLLADSVDIRSTDPVRPGYVVLEVHLVAEVHLGGDGGENKTLLPPVWQRELDFSVQSARSQ